MIEVDIKINDDLFFLKDNKVQSKKFRLIELINNPHDEDQSIVLTSDDGEIVNLNFFVPQSKNVIIESLLLEIKNLM